MFNLRLQISKNRDLLLKILPLIAFVVPLAWLFILDSGSFESMWKGRTFQLFFIWLIALELFLDWEKIQIKKTLKISAAQILVLIVTISLPTIYVIFSNYLNFNTAITNWALQSNIEWANSMPLSIEYLVFAGLFCLIAGVFFGFRELKAFFVPTFFLALVGILYTIDNVFPYGQFTPFQIFVPTTTAIAAIVLGLLGYNTNIVYEQNSLQGNMPVLTAIDPVSGISSSFKIAWPCAGIESFLIFTVITLLFLKRMHFSWKSKVGIFIFGAVITFIINVLRVVNIFLIDMKGVNIEAFHFYYGPLVAIAWIVSYPLIILGVQKILDKRKTKSN